MIGMALHIQDAFIFILIRRSRGQSGQCVRHEVLFARLVSNIQIKLREVLRRADQPEVKLVSI